MDNFARLIVPLQGRMTECVWRIVRDAHETDDVLQEVLVQVWQRFDEIQLHPNPTALLLCISTRKALDHLRRRKVRRAATAPLDDRVSSAQPNPVQQLAHSEEQARILTFIALLPAREAEALTLHVLDDLDYPAVAEAMGCTPATVRVLVARARERFRRAPDADRPNPALDAANT